MGTILSREAILAAPVATTQVEVPEWGGSVLIRALSIKARILLHDAIALNEAAHSAWREDQAKPEDEREGLARVDLYDQAILTVIHGIVDETGAQMFSVEDYDRFADLNYNTMVSLWVSMNNLHRTDHAAEKKSSASTRKGGSSTGSRSRSAKR